MVTNVFRNDASGRFAITFNLGLFQGMHNDLVVAGSFNDWSIQYAPTTTGIVYAPQRHKETTIELPPGYYEYKYYNATHRQWMEIEQQPELYHGPLHLFCYNVFGTKNCILDLR